jgi:signal transduction histidine kinase
VEAPDVPPVTGDPVRVRQVVDNLLVNALKFTPEGGTVALSARARDGGVEVTVRDTGPGIPEAERQKIFEKFYQIKGASIGGVGLGLAICKAIVELHGGRIWVDSEPGGGAAFHFTLPPSPPAAQPPRQSAAPGAARKAKV